MDVSAAVVAAASIAGGIIAAVLSAYLVVRHQMRQAIQASIDSAIDGIKADHRADRDVLHDKIDKVRDSQVRELLDRTAHIEGQLDGVTNMLNMLMRHLLGADAK